MNILLIGSGGREHALAWKIARSPHCDSLYILGGNAGTAQVGTNVSIPFSDQAKVLAFVREKKIGLVVIGPEQPLVEGLADYLREGDILVVGPGRKGAQLEGSKEYAKAFMDRYGIPTAAYASFSEHQMEAAMACIDEMSLPIVVKASGLAAGKGVLICEDRASAKEHTRQMLSGAAFGDAGNTVVIEQFLDGIEVSVFVLTDGEHYLILPEAKDYKRIGEGDTGLNTGGMGAVSPVAFADEQFMRQVETVMVQPTLAGLKAEGIDFRGFIFLGLMVENGKPYLLEYNVRMGDPETQVVIPRIQNDLLELLLAAADGRLHEQHIEVNPRTCSTVVLVSGGYPGSYEKGLEIDGLQGTEGELVFHAGTARDGDRILTNGGRVLAMSALGADLSEALSHSLRLAEEIRFEGKYYRRDIGRDLGAQ